MNILLIGSGGREHALAWKINQSPLVEKLYCFPSNGGIGQEAISVDVKSASEAVVFCEDNNIGLVVIGPEQPLVDGWSDELRLANINVFGCSQAAAQLEGSKGFTKDICAKYNIPTAAYGRFADAKLAKEYLASHPAPIVIKADGLAAGKGVIMAETNEQANAAIDDIFGGMFGDAGAEVVIEEWMQGEEASFFALCDGHHVKMLGSAQDHKRVGEGDVGLNTGGMGAYSPAPIMTDEMNKRVMAEIIEPTMHAMQKEGAIFRGIFFAGLMLTAQGPKLIEYNVRFGDPETQTLMLRLESDIVPLMMACAKGEGLADTELSLSDDAAICVVMAAKGYPESYEKNTEIKGLDTFDGMIFHAGTKVEDGKILNTGGRVLGICAKAASFETARTQAYNTIDTIDWPQGFYRRDIGWRAVKKAA